MMKTEKSNELLTKFQPDPEKEIKRLYLLMDIDTAIFSLNRDTMINVAMDTDIPPDMKRGMLDVLRNDADVLLMKIAANSMAIVDWRSKQ